MSNERHSSSKHRDRGRAYDRSRDLTSKSRQTNANQFSDRCRDKSSDSELKEQMQIILSRLNTLERQSTLPSAPSSEHFNFTPAGTPPPQRMPPLPPQPERPSHLVGCAREACRQDNRCASAPTTAQAASSRVRSASDVAERDLNATDRIVNAIRSINNTVTGKLDSGMRGPYRVVTALPHDRYELRLVAGSYGKSTQAAAENLVPWRGEWTPETCSAFFKSAEINDDESMPSRDIAGHPEAEACPESLSTTRTLTSDGVGLMTTTLTADPSMADVGSPPISMEENEDVLLSGETVLEKK